MGEIPNLKDDYKCHTASFAPNTLGYSTPGRLYRLGSRDVPKLQRTELQDTLAAW